MDLDERHEQGGRVFREVLGREPVQGDEPLRAVGLGFLFGEVWGRPGLTRKERRWITLTAVGACGAEGPIEVHMRAALVTGDITFAEIDEFILHCAGYLGYPTASVLATVARRLESELGDGDR